MACEFTQDMPESIRSIITKAVDICNDDFSPCKFAQAFPSTIPKMGKNKPFLNFLTDFDGTSSNSGPQSCPSAGTKPIFTFKESSFAPKHSFDDSEVPAMKPTGAPTLKLQITGNPGYVLDECDILDIVSNYAIVNIEVTGPRQAFITFDEAANAIEAQKALNGTQVKHLNIKMFFSCTDGLKEAPVEQAPERRIKKSSTAFVPGLTRFDEEFHSNGMIQSFSNIDADLPTFQYNKSDKLTCKYEVQIEGDLDFKIASKIIGPRGVNMKKILDLCQQHAKKNNIPFQNDSIKLRLRGIGSGFKEGPEKKESDEALHLCVSAKHAQIFEVACKFVEDLLKGLYGDYQTMRSNMGRPLEAPVQIKRVGIYDDFAEEKPLSRKDSIDEKFVEKKNNKKIHDSTSGSGSPANSHSSLSERSSPPTHWRSPQSQWRTIATKKSN